MSVVGLIGFIGLAAPAMVRLLGSENWPAAAVGTILGALLLAATDLLLQTPEPVLACADPDRRHDGPVGAPLLLWLIPRLGIKQRCA